MKHTNIYKCTYLYRISMYPSCLLTSAVFYYQNAYTWFQFEPCEFYEYGELGGERESERVFIAFELKSIFSTWRLLQIGQFTCVLRKHTYGTNHDDIVIVSQWVKVPNAKQTHFLHWLAYKRHFNLIICESHLVPKSYNFFG